MSTSWLGFALDQVERGHVPDSVVRWGIRRLCRQRLLEIDPGDDAARERAVAAFADELRRGPVAPVPEKANEQHYELPPEFFGLVLGRHRKYSGAYWPAGVTTLDEAEFAALGETCHRAELTDGLDILELGCGWGSLTLWMAERYPNARITAVSNSHAQRGYIEGEAAQRGFTNVRVITADMNDFAAPERYDRVVSVEMFEHMGNYATLLDRVADWLRPDGKMLVHVFCHATCAYRFETDGDDNWMGRYFFTGGIMPSADLFERFDERMTVAERWWWDGTHYQRTADAWVRNLTDRRAEAMKILERTYGAKDAVRWYNRWRVFFMACAELFGLDGGRQWGVAHSRLELRPSEVETAVRETELVG